MKLKRMITVLLACVTCLSLLAACGRKDEAQQPSGGSDGGEKLDISIAIWDVVSGVTSPEEDAIYGTISDKFNVVFTPVNTTWDDYEQKVQAWAASGQLPDYFAVDAYGKPYYSTWVQEGIVKDLTDEIQKYPHIAAMMEGEDFQAYSTDGRFYCIPRPNYTDGKLFANEKALLLRKDLMEAAGWSKENQPQNLDDFIQMIQDMMEIGNCEVGITAFDRNFMCMLAVPYAPTTIDGGNVPIWEDNQWKAAVMTDQAREAAIAMGKMYAAGIIDKDAPTLTEDAGKNKFCAGQAAAYCYGGYPSALMVVENTWSTTRPDENFADSIVLWRPWANADGNLYYKQAMSPWSETYFRGDISQEKLDAMLSVMDYLLSEEGLTLMRLGIEGEDYTVDANGEVTVLLEGQLGEKYPFVNDCGTQWLSTWDQEFQYENPVYSQDIVALAKEQLNWWLDNGVSDVSSFVDFRTNFFDPTFMEDYADIQAEIAAPYMTAYITGEKAAETWDAQVAEYVASGYEARFKEYSDAMIAAGISK